MGYQTILVWDTTGEVAGFIELLDAAIDRIEVRDGYVIVTWTICDPEILACIPAGTDQGKVVFDGTDYLLADV